MADLKPCPFCGGEAKMMYACGEYFIGCENKCPQMHSGEEQTIEAWNRRSLEPEGEDKVCDECGGRGFKTIDCTEGQATVDCIKCNGTGKLKE